MEPVQESHGKTAPLNACTQEVDNLVRDIKENHESIFSRLVYAGAGQDVEAGKKLSSQAEAKDSDSSSYSNSPELIADVQHKLAAGNPPERQQVSLSHSESPCTAEYTSKSPYENRSLSHAESHTSSKDDDYSIVRIKQNDISSSSKQHARSPQDSVNVFSFMKEHSEEVRRPDTQDEAKSRHLKTQVDLEGNLKAAEATSVFDPDAKEGILASVEDLGNDAVGSGKTVCSEENSSQQYIEHCPQAGSSSSNMHEGLFPYDAEREESKGEHLLCNQVNENYSEERLTQSSVSNEIVKVAHIPLTNKTPTSQHGETGAGEISESSRGLEKHHDPMLQARLRLFEDITRPKWTEFLHASSSSASPIIRGVRNSRTPTRLNSLTPRSNLIKSIPAHGAAAQKKAQIQKLQSVLKHRDEVARVLQSTLSRKEEDLRYLLDEKMDLCREFMNRLSEREESSALCVNTCPEKKNISASRSDDPSYSTTASPHFHLEKSVSKEEINGEAAESVEGQRGDGAFEAIKGQVKNRNSTDEAAANTGNESLSVKDKLELFEGLLKQRECGSHSSTSPTWCRLGNIVRETREPRAESATPPQSSRVFDLAESEQGTDAFPEKENELEDLRRQVRDREQLIADLEKEMTEKNSKLSALLQEKFSLSRDFLELVADRHERAPDFLRTVIPYVKHPVTNTENSDSFPDPLRSPKRTTSTIYYAKMTSQSIPIPPNTPNYTKPGFKTLPKSLLISDHTLQSSNRAVGEQMTAVDFENSAGAETSKEPDRCGDSLLEQQGASRFRSSASDLCSKVVDTAGLRQNGSSKQKFTFREHFSQGRLKTVHEDGFEASTGDRENNYTSTGYFLQYEANSDAVVVRHNGCASEQRPVSTVATDLLPAATRLRQNIVTSDGVKNLQIQPFMMQKATVPYSPSAAHEKSSFDYVEGDESEEMSDKLTCDFPKNSGICSFAQLGSTKNSLDTVVSCANQKVPIIRHACESIFYCDKLRRRKEHLATGQRVELTKRTFCNGSANGDDSPDDKQWTAVAHSLLTALHNLARSSKTYTAEQENVTGPSNASVCNADNRREGAGDTKPLGNICKHEKPRKVRTASDYEITHSENQKNKEYWCDHAATEKKKCQGLLKPESKNIPDAFRSSHQYQQGIGSSMPLYECLHVCTSRQRRHSHSHSLHRENSYVAENEQQEIDVSSDEDLALLSPYDQMDARRNCVRVSAGRDTSNNQDFMLPCFGDFNTCLKKEEHSKSPAQCTSPCEPCGYCKGDNSLARLCGNMGKNHASAQEKHFLLPFKGSTLSRGNQTQHAVGLKANAELFFETLSVMLEARVDEQLEQASGSVLDYPEQLEGILKAYEEVKQLLEEVRRIRLENESLRRCFNPASTHPGCSREENNSQLSSVEPSRNRPTVNELPQEIPFTSHHAIAQVSAGSLKDSKSMWTQKVYHEACTGKQLPRYLISNVENLQDNCPICGNTRQDRIEIETRTQTVIDALEKQVQGLSSKCRYLEWLDEMMWRRITKRMERDVKMGTRDTDMSKGAGSTADPYDVSMEKEYVF